MVYLITVSMHVLCIRPMTLLYPCTAAPTLYLLRHTQNGGSWSFYGIYTFIAD